MKRIKDRCLYLVIAEECAKGRTAYDSAKAAIKGGVDIIQMREKNRSRKELVDLGKKLCRLCKDNDIIFIVNDDPDFARELDADGVHLGQEDILEYPLERARATLGPNKIIGISTHSMEQFKRADDEDFDYIAFGPIFKTKTKDYFLGAKDVARVAAAARKDLFFIGGIDLSNIGELLGKGARNIALIRGILEADNIESKTREFKNRLLREHWKSPF